MRRCFHVQCLSFWLRPAALLLGLLTAESVLPVQGWAQISLEPELSPEVYFDEAANEQREQLRRAASFLADKQYDEAVETLRRVLESPGTKLIRAVPGDNVPNEFSRYVSLKEYGHLHLAALKKSAPEALDLYRSRVDPLAERWFKQGVAERDERLLARIVDQLFNSTFGDDALYRLGEFALERGEYAKARECWERLSPLLRSPAKDKLLPGAAAGRPLWLALRGVKLDEQWPDVERFFTQTAAPVGLLVYPDTDLNLADVRARLVLVSILEGSQERARLELELLKKLHAGAEGHVGGRTGKYADLLAEILSEAAAWTPVKAPADWRTFGGTQERGQVSRFEPDVRGKPLWSVELPRLTADREQIGFGRQRIAEEFDGLLSYHPLLVHDPKAGDVVLLAEPGYVKAFSIATGQPAWPGAEEPGAIFPTSKREGDVADSGDFPRRRPYVGVPRFTLTSHHTKLFARLGSPITAFKDENGRLKQPGNIVGLDLATQRKLFEIEPDGANWAFEGPPVTDGSRLYVAMRRSENTSARSDAHLACFDAQTAELRWRRWICGANTPSKGQWDELTHTLLSLQDGVLYFNTNLGAVAAVTAEDGAVKWVARYPRAPFRSHDLDRNDVHFFRDLTPCLIHDGLAICAPADCDRIFALDAATGQTVWETGKQRGADAVHLLGVGGGNVLASGDYLYWIDINSGTIVGQFPQPRSGGPGFARADPPGFGRGILAGDNVYWPTREKIFVFRQQTTKTEKGWSPIPVREIELTHRGVTGGNLLMAKGILLIATSNKLYALSESK